MAMNKFQKRQMPLKTQIAISNFSSQLNRSQAGLRFMLKILKRLNNQKTIKFARISSLELIEHTVF